MYLESRIKITIESGAILSWTAFLGCKKCFNDITDQGIISDHFAIGVSYLMKNTYLKFRLI
jgi:hypothetical protein